MTLNILLFIAGVALILFGADALVEGASGIAKKFGMSEFLIGATIVGIGTSVPEMVVSFLAAFNGNADIAVGNITGSNIFNVLAILGATAMICPIAITKTNYKRDLTMALAAALLMLALSVDKFIVSGTSNVIGRIDGAILLAMFAFYMIWSFRQDSGDNQTADEDSASGKEKSVWILAAMILLGIGALVGGGNLFVNSASDIAKALGVSDAVIAMTLMAGGTSLPELASCIVAARKGKVQLALGNVVGSNISNILLIIGGSALICPLNVNPENFLAMIIGPAVTALLYLTTITPDRRKIGRLDGFCYLLLLAGYIVLMATR